MAEHRDVVVIGAGQAGLATSYYLTDAGCDHVVLERDRVGERWRSERWDSFTLVTPNLLTRLPGFPYEGDDPDGFLTRDEVVEYLDAYVDRFDPPLRTGVEVLAVRQIDTGYTVETTDTTYETTNVVVATGPFQRPRIPEFGAVFPSSIRQLHTRQYRNPDQLDPGGVLVVGSGQSGTQIAQELHESGRDVYLSVGKAAKAPSVPREGHRQVDGCHGWIRGDRRRPGLARSPMRTQSLRLGQGRRPGDRPPRSHR